MRSVPLPHGHRRFPGGFPGVALILTFCFPACDSQDVVTGFPAPEVPPPDASARPDVRPRVEPEAPTSLLEPREPSLEVFFTEASVDPAKIVPMLLAVSERMQDADAATASALGDRLEPYCRRLFFGPDKVPGMAALGVATHAVKAGEYPFKIAAAHGIEVDHLLALNPDVDPKKLRVGQRLKALDLKGGSLDLAIDLGRFRLALWRTLPEGAPHAGSRILLMQVPIATGAAPLPSPDGATKIDRRVKDPKWTDPKTKKVHRPGDPAHPFGHYYLGLDPEGIDQDRIAIHAAPATAPKVWLEHAVTNGSIWLEDGDLANLYSCVRVGTKVAVAR